MSHDILNKNVHFFIQIVCKYVPYESDNNLKNNSFKIFAFFRSQNFLFVVNQHLSSCKILWTSYDYCTLFKNLLFIIFKVFQNNETCLQYMNLHLLHINNKRSCFFNLTFLHRIKANLHLHLHPLYMYVNLM